MNPLASFRLVLVGPRTAGNVGACARVASNFGCRDWVIVAPRCRFKNWDARKYATRDAREYLASVRVTRTLEEALADCQIAIGFTHRSGKRRRPSIELGDIASLVQGRKKPPRIALVFGNEKTGLSNEELEACNRTCRIATPADAQSLNLSHAAAAVLSRVYSGRVGEKLRSSAARRAPGAAKSAPDSAATAALGEFEGMIRHWSEFLADIDMVRAGNPERMARSLREIFKRAALSSAEVSALRGVLSKAQVRLGVRARGVRLEA